jgi:uncharacterized integral membrane protein (TIGR00697 family)
LLNVFVTKEINLFGLTVTASDALAVGISLCLNLVQSRYGKNESHKAIWIGFGSLLFYLAVSLLHLAYQPATTDTMQTHFSALLAPMPRIIIASFIAYIIAQHADWFLFRFSKQIFSRRFLVFRNYFSIIIAQLLDTLIFSYLGLYGIVSNITHIIIFSYLIKLLTIFGIVTLFSTLLQWIPERIYPTKNHKKP